MSALSPRGTRPTAVLGLLVGAFLVATSGCGAAPAARTEDRTAASPTPAAADIRPASVDEVIAAVRAPGAEVVVLNVWATWCAPCREEFPDLVRLHREYGDRGLRLVLVSADAPGQIDAARTFLKRHGVDFPSYLKSGADMAFIDALTPSWSGALPATLVYDGRGRLTWFHEGKASYEMLEREVSKLLVDASQHPKET